jgi:hypothetical protein
LFEGVAKSPPYGKAEVVAPGAPPALGAASTGAGKLAIFVGDAALAT